MDILHQLGGLVLGSVPTMIFFILLVAAYGLLVGRPLASTLAERYARTNGAVQQARAAISAAEAETAAYEDKLRLARSEIMASRERLAQQLQEQRDQAVTSARATAQGRVNEARVDIETASKDARKQIEDAVSQLSEQIVRTMLRTDTKLQLPEVRQ